MDQIKLVIDGQVTFKKWDENLTIADNVNSIEMPVQTVICNLKHMKDYETIVPKSCTVFICCQWRLDHEIDVKKKKKNYNLAVSSHTMVDTILPWSVLNRLDHYHSSDYFLIFL
eukprot:NODE_257_length_11653_cov_0.298858.p9 type:complete len:114 gc:universal NODE_257_length_11653_cov_0.298858:10642-10983(+)